MTSQIDPTKSYKTYYTKTYLDGIDPAIYTFLVTKGYSNGSETIVAGEYLDGALLVANQTEPDVIVDAAGDPVCFWGLNGCGGQSFDTFGLKDSVDVCGSTWAGADSISQLLPVFNNSSNQLVAKGKAEQTVRSGGSETYQATTIALDTTGIKTMTTHSITINNPSSCLPMRGLVNFENTFEVELDAFTGLVYRPVITVNAGPPTPDADRFKIYGSYFFDDYANHNINPYTIPIGGSLSLVNQSTIDVTIAQPGSLWYASNSSMDWIFVNE